MCSSVGPGDERAADCVEGQAKPGGPPRYAPASRLNAIFPGSGARPEPNCAGASTCSPHQGRLELFVFVARTGRLGRRRLGGHQPARSKLRAGTKLPNTVAPLSDWPSTKPGGAYPKDSSLAPGDRDAIIRWHRPYRAGITLGQQPRRAQPGPGFSISAGILGRAFQLAT